jgi:hypothetical protein
MAIAQRGVTPAAAGRELLPSTHAVLIHPAIAALRASFTHEILASLVRQAKERPLNGARTKQEALDAIVDEVTRAAGHLTFSSRRLINATGIVIHTGLGTATLSPMARSTNGFFSFAWNSVRERRLVRAVCPHREHRCEACRGLTAATVQPRSSALYAMNLLSCAKLHPWNRRFCLPLRCRALARMPVRRSTAIMAPGPTLLTICLLLLLLILMGVVLWATGHLVTR